MIYKTTERNVKVWSGMKYIREIEFTLVSQNYSAAVIWFDLCWCAVQIFVKDINSHFSVKLSEEFKSLFDLARVMRGRERDALGNGLRNTEKGRQ